MICVKLKNIIRLLIILFVICLSGVLTINIKVINTGKQYIITIDEIDPNNDYDCILVLGAGIVGDEPSPMLKERLDTGIEIYNENLISTFIMSGDHTRINHDEVNVMKNYAYNKGIPSSAIFMDHAGISTYDSLYRAKYVFGVKKVLIITEEYHLYRALYIAHNLGIEAYGVDATKEVYSGQVLREIREVLARNKDFVKTIFKPKATYGGSTISLNQSGDITNDNYLIISTLNGSEKYYISSFMTYKTINDYITKKEYIDYKCNCLPEYYLTFNDNEEETYGIMLYGKEIHITKDDKKIKLTEEESKVLFNIINGEEEESS